LPLAAATVACRFRLASGTRHDYAHAEYDGAGRKSDQKAQKPFRPLKNLGKIVSAVMQRLQVGLAWAQLALHMQQDYLAVIEAHRLKNKQN